MLTLDHARKGCSVLLTLPSDEISSFYGPALTKMSDGECDTKQFTFVSLCSKNKIVSGSICRLHFLVECDCEWMVPRDETAKYRIEFYPKSTQELEGYKHHEELSYIWEALDCDVPYHKIFLVSDGHCYAACDIRGVNEKSKAIDIVVLYIYTMKDSRRKGHCSDMLKFLRYGLNLHLRLFAETDTCSMNDVCRKLGMEQRFYYEENTKVWWLPPLLLMNPWSFPAEQ